MFVIWNRQCPGMFTADSRGGQSEPQALKTTGHTICSVSFREAQANGPGECHCEKKRVTSLFPAWRHYRRSRRLQYRR
jgi:hypothetical protein